MSKLGFAQAVTAAGDDWRVYTLRSMRFLSYPQAIIAGQDYVSSRSESDRRDMMITKYPAFRKSVLNREMYQDVQDEANRVRESWGIAPARGTPTD